MKKEIEEIQSLFLLSQPHPRQPRPRQEDGRPGRCLLLVCKCKQFQCAVYMKVIRLDATLDLGYDIG